MEATDGTFVLDTDHIFVHSHPLDKIEGKQIQAL